MAPVAKRARPAFSPPRPGTSKTKKANSNIDVGVDVEAGVSGNGTTSKTKKRTSAVDKPKTTATKPGRYSTTKEQRMRGKAIGLAKAAEAREAKAAKAAEERAKQKGKEKMVISQSSRQAQKRSRYTSATESESDSQGADDTDNNEGESQDGNQDEDMTGMGSDEDGEEEEEDENNSVPASASDSEPDFILAEVTTTHSKTRNKTTTNPTLEETSNPSNPPIPLALLHRIIHSHFIKPEKTKISKDARELVGKYIEIFTREAIMRCGYEKRNAGGNIDGGDGSRRQEENETETNPIIGDGWLEVEDLEKVAVQLCLDF